MKMNLKDFDYKQFLLEKGEQVGLGIAVALMVLMLLFSLFMPSRGFFSGSPSEKAKPLEEGSKSLQNALNTLQPTKTEDKPGTTEGKLIAFNTAPLGAQPYEVLALFEPRRSDNPARRPPTILNVEEALVAVAQVPVDTYMFQKDYTHVLVLQESEKSKAKSQARPAGQNPLNRIASMSSGAQPGVPSTNNPLLQKLLEKQQDKQRRLLERLRGLKDDESPYEVKWVPRDKVDGSTRLARRLQPLRMAIIAASFPYKAQLEEFKNKLRLPSLQDVLNDTPVGEGKEKSPAFHFRDVQVQRTEMDANGKPVDASGKPLNEAAWMDLLLADSYRPLLQDNGWSFQEDDHKFDPIKFPGLVMPRLREFHEERPQNATSRGPQPPPGPRSAAPKETMSKEGESKYPDIESKLEKIQATLQKLGDLGSKRVAAPSAKSRDVQTFDPFNPNSVGSSDEQKTEARTASAQDPIPEYCLVRLVDANIEPGKFYRYRLKIRMANPNYNRTDVASMSYKEDKYLLSKEWYVVPQTVKVPPELIYYVVDEKEIKKDGKPYTGINRYADPDRERQTVFQLHRLVETASIDKDGNQEMIGDWAVADRVLVARGEYVGQTVRVDLPVWKYSRDSFILPTAERKGREQAKSGVLVHFGQENTDQETILVDFEGGRRFHEQAAPVAEGAPKTTRVDDVSSVEVLMLSPDGKLLARNSAADRDNEERAKIRDYVHRRIQEVKEGKSSGVNPGGGLDLPRTGGGRPPGKN
jgi:hypothetical protein